MSTDQRAKRRVGDVVGLQVELVERGQELRHGADALVRHIDAVVDGDGDEAWVQRGPEPLLRDLVAAGNLQLEKALQELHQRLESAVTEIIYHVHETSRLQTTPSSLQHTGCKVAICPRGNRLYSQINFIIGDFISGFKRKVQLDVTRKLHMLFERCHTKNRTSIKHR